MKAARASSEITVKTFHDIEKGFDFQTTKEEIDRACQFFASNLVSHEGKLYIVMPEDFFEEIGMSATLALSQETDPRNIGYRVMQEVARALVYRLNE